MQKYSIIILLASLCFTTVAAENEHSLSKKAWNLINAGKPEEAIRAFKRALQINPKHGYAYRGIGWVYNNKLKKYKWALKYYHKASELMPDVDWLMLEYGDVYKNKKEFRKALNYFNRAFIIYDKSGKAPSVWYVVKHTEILMNIHKSNNASYKFMRKWMKHYLNTPEFFRHFGNLYYKEKDYANALKYYRRASRADKNVGKKTPMMYYWKIANLYANHIKDKGKSIQSAREWLSVHKNDPASHYWGANLYKDMKMYRDAVKHYDRAYKLYRKNGRTPPINLVYNASSVYIHNLKMESYGIRYLVSKKDIYRNEPGFFSNLGYKYMYVKNYKNTEYYFLKAIKMYLKARKRVPMYLYSDLSVIYIFKKPYRPAKSIPHLKAILNDPTYKYIDKEYTVNWLVHAYQKAKKFDKMVKLAGEHLPRIKSQKEKKKISSKLAHYFYWNKRNIKKATHYYKMAGNDKMVKNLGPKKVIINAEYFFKKAMKYHYLKPGIVRINLPIDRKYQKFLYVKSIPNYRRIFKIKERRYIEFDFRLGFPEILKLEVAVNWKVMDRLPKKFHQAKKPQDKNYYFASHKTKFLDIDNPLLVNLAKRIIRNKQTQKEKIHAVYKWIYKNTKYTKKKLNIKKISDVYKLGRFYSCVEITSLFVGMLRLLNIPARTLYTVSHVPAEVFDADSNRWIYVEPQGGYPLGIGPYQSMVFSHEMSPDEKHPKLFIRIGTLNNIHYTHFKMLDGKYIKLRVEYPDSGE